MEKVLANPEYIPDDDTPRLMATRVDVHAIPKKHQIEKIRWIFKQYRTVVCHLILPDDWLLAFKKGEKICFDEIKAPFDALKKLELRGQRPNGEAITTDSITTETLSHLASICPKVEELHLQDCLDITVIPKNFKHLEILSIVNKIPNPDVYIHTDGLSVPGKNPYHFKSDALDLLAKSSPTIEHLNFHNCCYSNVVPGTIFKNLRSFIRTGISYDGDCKPWETNPKLEILMLSQTHDRSLPQLGIGVKFLLCSALAVLKNSI